MSMMLAEMVGNGRILHGVNEKPSGGQIGHAHYNSAWCCELTTKYPDADQFFTFLRNPFDRMVSWYFYIKHIWKGHVWDIRLSEYGNTLRGFLEGYRPDAIQFLPAGQYPCRLDDFVFVGITERLHDGIRALSRILNKPVPKLLSTNAAVRDEAVPDDMRQGHREMYQDVYETYEYAVQTWHSVYDTNRK